MSVPNHDGTGSWSSRLQSGSVERLGGRGGARGSLPKAQRSWSTGRPTRFGAVRLEFNRFFCKNSVFRRGEHAPTWCLHIHAPGLRFCCEPRGQKSWSTESRPTFLPGASPTTQVRGPATTRSGLVVGRPPTPLAGRISAPRARTRSKTSRVDAPVMPALAPGRMSVLVTVCLINSAVDGAARAPRNTHSPSPRASLAPPRDPGAPNFANCPSPELSTLWYCARGSIFALRSASSSRRRRRDAALRLGRLWQQERRHRRAVGAVRRRERRWRPHGLRLRRAGHAVGRVPIAQGGRRPARAEAKSVAALYIRPATASSLNPRHPAHAVWFFTRDKTLQRPRAARRSTTHYATGVPLREADVLHFTLSTVHIGVYGAPYSALRGTE